MMFAVGMLILRNYIILYSNSTILLMDELFDSLRLKLICYIFWIAVDKLFFRNFSKGKNTINKVFQMFNLL